MSDTKKKLLFIIPSTLGVLLFMVPILVNKTWTIAVKLLSDVINGVIGGFLPLLLDFGLLEYVGAQLTKWMRPIFMVPGRAAVDCITSWIGDGTLGVMLTCNQYEGGYYSAKEASIIATTFSAVSITFSLVVLNQVGLMQYFGVYYLIICFIGVVCATQVLFLDEVGGLILGSKLPVNLPELFVIFLERTIISLLIVCPLAHLIF